MATLKDKIIEILVNSKQITEVQLKKALDLQKEKQLPLRQVLIAQGLIQEEELLSMLSQQLYMPTLHLAKYKFDPELIHLVPEHIARQYKIIPLSRIGATLTVAMSDPLNIFALDMPSFLSVNTIGTSNILRPLFVERNSISSRA